MTTNASAKDLPNYNAYDGQRPVTPALLPSARTLARGAATSMDEQRGVPSFLWAGPSPSGSAPPQIAVASHEQAARLHLKTVGSIYGVSEQALATATVTGIHDLGRGGIIVTLRQVIDGVELYRSDVKVLMRRDHELVAISGSPHPSAVAGMGKNGVRKFTISAEDALTNALNDLYETKLSPSSVLDVRTVKAGYRYFDLLPTPEVKATNLRMSEPARVKKVYFPMPDRLVPAYFVEVLAGAGSGADADAYSYVIAADDGRLLYRENLKHNAVFNYRVWADAAAAGGRPLDGPIANFTPHPTGAPDGSFPAYISMPPLIAMDGFNTNPSKMSDPWLPAGATETVGNNVDAYVDIFGSDGYSPAQGDFRADVTSPGTFDRIYDLTQDPVPNGMPNQSQGKAALAQIFYTTNWLHDWWYDSGFNEEAGNAQMDNYGRGGIAGDPLRAEAEDDANNSSNDSNMSAMSDGMSPRMQMYLWKGRSLATLTVNPGNQSYAVGTATFGPQSFSLTAPIVLGVDATAPVNNGCEPLTNNVFGQVVLVDRGLCPFEQKTVNAQNAGAVGIIIANNVAGGPVQMPPPNPPLGGNIPAMSVTKADGATLKLGLLNGMLSASMFNTPPPMADGALDNTVVAHEWGHYLHLRQVKGCSSQQCVAESEGFGDYNAAQMIVRPGDNLDGTFALWIYATAADRNAGYFGIRRFPYSTDMTKNALTFKHIGDGVELPASTPKNPAIGGSNAEVHNAGEVWATMLWEAHVAILKNAQGPNAPYTFAQAQRRMSDYIEAGLLMAPPDPTITEQRDAILAAALAADMNDFFILTGAFAKRGAGSCAKSPAKSSSSLTGVEESFAVSPAVSIVDTRIDDSVSSCDTDGVLDAGEKGKVTVTVKNTGTGPLTKTSMTVFSDTPGVSFPNGAVATFGAIAPFATGTASVEIDLDKSIMGIHKLGVTVTVTDPDACSKTETTTTSAPINYDIDQMASSTDDVEIMPSTWKPTSEGGPADIWSIREPTPLTHVWTGVDYGSPSDASLESPPLDVAATENFTLTFNYRHQFDQSMDVNWDGGVIEVSTNDGMTWTDISTYGPVAQYTGTIGDPMNQAINVLKGRKGFVGQSPSWPAMDSATIDLGNQLAGETVKIRFRVGSDDGQGAYGWDVDDIAFSGITNKPFPATLPNTNPCTVPPVADAGPDQTVESGDLVTLDGSKSSDPRMLPLTYAWSALDWPTVTLGGANSVKSTFTAPSVKTDTPMIFALSVSDGQGSASATTHVLVKPSTKSVDGCGCSTVGSPSGAISPLVGVALLALRRRRRTGGRPRG